MSKHNLIDLIGLPYSEYNCWDVVAKYHGIDLKFNSDMTGKAKLKFQIATKKRFTQIPKPEKTGDLILQNTHVMLYVKEPVEGIIQGTLPYSEFRALDFLDLGEVTYWRKK